MPRVHTKRPGSRTYKSYTQESLNEAVKDIPAKKISLRKASAKYKIPVGTLSHRLNEKHGQRPGHPSVFSQEEEEVFVSHIKVVAEWGFPFDDMDMRMLAYNYLTAQGHIVKQFKNNFPSKEWSMSFMKRHKSQLVSRLCQNIKRTRASLSADEVASYFEHLKTSLTDGNDFIPPDRIFNYDETNLSNDSGVKKCIFKRGNKHPERIKNSSKTAISIMYCGSAVGQILPCYVVYKAENLWSTWTEGGPKNTRFNRSKSGWFDACCFTDWFESVFVPHAKRLPGRKAIIGDNLSSQFTDKVMKLAAEHNIAFLCLPPASTHMLQPLDMAFYGPLKKSWRKILNDRRSGGKKNSKILNKEAFPALLAKLHNTIFPEGTSYSKNLESGFAKCGIHPFNPKSVLDQLPDYAEVQEASEHMHASVSEVVVGMLRAMRGVDKPRMKKR